MAIQADDAVAGNGELRRFEERMRDIKRHLGRKSKVGDPRGGAGALAGVAEMLGGVAPKFGRAAGRGREAAPVPSKCASR